MKSKSSLLLFVLAYAGFISIGLPDGLIGVAWPSIRGTFKLPVDALGVLLMTFTAGYLISSFSSGRMLTKFSLGALLSLSCLATAASLLGYALAPGWPVMVSFGALSGLGAGAIDAGLNTFAATRFSSRTINWLHASYGVGTTSGPLLMTGVMGAGLTWRWGYAIVGLGQLALAFCFALSRRSWEVGNDSAERPVEHSTTASINNTLRLPAVWLSIAVFFLYAGVEAAAGAWSYTLFTESRGVPMGTAGAWVSLYWGAFTIGRIVSGLAADKIPAKRLLRFSIAGMALGAVLLWLNLTAYSGFAGLVFMGIAAAPIFPTLIATTPGRIGEIHTSNSVGFQIAAAALGLSLLPALVGLSAEEFGLESVGPVLFSSSILLFAAYELLILVGRARETPMREPGIAGE
jgi:fucose permease